MTRAEIIDALARFMAKQDDRDIEEREYIPGNKTWYATAYQKKDRDSSYYHAKAEKFLDRWTFVEQITSGRE